MSSWFTPQSGMMRQTRDNVSESHRSGYSMATGTTGTNLLMSQTSLPNESMTLPSRPTNPTGLGILGARPAVANPPVSFKYDDDFSKAVKPGQVYRDEFCNNGNYWSANNSSQSLLGKRNISELTHNSSHHGDGMQEQVKDEFSNHHYSKVQITSSVPGKTHRMAQVNNPLMVGPGKGMFRLPLDTDKTAGNIQSQSQLQNGLMVRPLGAPKVNTQMPDWMKSLQQQPDSSRPVPSYMGDGLLGEGPEELRINPVKRLSSGTGHIAPREMYSQRMVTGLSGHAATCGMYSQSMSSGLSNFQMRPRVPSLVNTAFNRGVNNRPRYPRPVSSYSKDSVTSYTGTAKFSKRARTQDSIDQSVPNVSTAEELEKVEESEDEVTDNTTDCDEPEATSATEVPPEADPPASSMSENPASSGSTDSRPALGHQLIISQVPENTTAAQLKEMISQHCKVGRCTIARISTKQGERLAALLGFETVEDCDSCLQYMNGYNFKGIELKIRKA